MNPLALEPHAIKQAACKTRVNEGFWNVLNATWPSPQAMRCNVLGLIKSFKPVLCQQNSLLGTKSLHISLKLVSSQADW